MAHPLATRFADAVRLLAACAAFAAPLSAQTPGFTGRPLPAMTARPVAEAVVAVDPADAPPTAARPATQASAFNVGLDMSYHSVDVATDAAGGRHALFATYVNVNGTTKPVLYAYCAPGAACDNAASWSRTPVGLDGFYYLQLEVTADGRPRVLAYDAQIEVLGVPRHTQYVYAACEAGCTSAANWDATELWTTLNGSALHAADFSPHSFALDAQGRPRLVYLQDVNTRASYFAGCDAACTTPGNWWHRPMTGASWDDLEDSDLEIGSDGRPQVLTTTHAGNATQAAYATCSGACASESDWTLTSIVVIAEDGYCSDAPDGCTVSMDLDNQNRPRVGLQGPHIFPIYAWCDAHCDTSDNWYGVSFTIQGAKYPTVATDAQGRTSVAYQQWGTGGGLGYAWCTADCEGNSPDWSADLFDLSATLQQEFSIPPPANCVEGEWQTGFRPSLAYLPDGTPLVGHDAEYLMFCAGSGGQWSYEPRWWTSRIVSFPRPGATAVEPDGPASSVSLGTVAPNPTRGASATTFTLAEAGEATVDLFDVTGRVVARVAEGTFAAGEHRVELGTAGLAPGVYTVRLQAAGGVATRRLSVVQ